MGMRAFEPVVKIDNLVPGGTASVNLAIGNSYDRIYLHLAGDLEKADITNIKIELDGKILSQYRNVTELESIQQGYHSRLIEANVIEFIFAQTDITKTVEEGRFFALGTMGLTTAVISFDVHASVTNPKVEAVAEKSGASATGHVFKTRIYPNAISAGVSEITNIPRLAGLKIARVHVLKAEGDLTKAELIIDNKSWFNLKKPQAETVQKRYGKTPQANMLHVDFMLEGDMFQTITFPSAQAVAEGKALPVQDMRLRLEATTEGTAIVYVEYIDVWSPHSF